MGVFSKVGPFLHELQRRRVWRTVIAYAAVVFVALQLAEIVFPAFGAPDGALRILVVTSFLGFPVVLALAWVFDVTPHGIEKSGAGMGGSGTQRYTGSTLPRLALLGVTLAVVGGMGWWTVQDAVADGGSLASPTNDPAIAASTGEKPLQVRSLAVLPLEDISQGDGGAYFTAGLHEELVSQLSQIGAARVLSRTTVVEYDRAGKTMPVLARELGVEGVVEGSVFRDGNRVRITVQLIHGPTDQHLWANSYEGTLEDAIALQRTVAQAIAREISAELFPQNDEVLPITRVAATKGAQEEYLKGRFEQSKGTPEGLASAVGHYEAAVAEDSTYAPAYAGLAAARLLRESLRVESSAPDTDVDQLGPSVVDPLEKAFLLDRESPEARSVLLAINTALGELPNGILREGLVIIQDSAALLQAEVDLASTEFGRQLQQVIFPRPPQPGDRSPPSERLRSARRLQATANFDEAERVIRIAVEEAPDSPEAWETLEQIKTQQGDFEGVVEVRKQWLSHAPHEAEAEASLKELEIQLLQNGERGYWSWRAEELKERRAEGEDVSWVQIARALVGVQEYEEAIGHLRQAVEDRDRELVSLWTDPAWDSLRTDPAFRKILSDIRRDRGDGGILPR